jgi:hypothetical protein
VTGLAALSALARRVMADPYRPVALLGRADHAVRIRGRVTARGRGVTGVVVSDGRLVVSTDADGRFELRSDVSRRFVSVQPPAGYRLPVGPHGTLLLHRPIRPDASGEMQVLFPLEPLAEPEDRHAFLVLADPQTQDAYEMGRFHAETVPDVRETVAGLGLPTFGVGCGDIMYDDLTLYPEYERAVQAMGIPFAQVVGNHDLDQTGRTDEASTETFSGYFGPRWYAFDRGRIHYVVLDDVFWHGAGYLGYLDQDQLAWLEADLARLERGRLVVVFLHIPVTTAAHLRRGRKSPEIATAVTNREALHRLLEPFRARIFTGHMHESDHVFEGGVHEHNLGTVCGAWWTGDICHDGTPNGYGVFEVSGDDLRWYYKATGKPVGHQMRVYPRGADPAAPGEIVANVWNWDPEWTVVWYEGADRRGAMARRTGFDPMSVALHTGEDLPARRGWVDPVPTSHLFYAPVGSGVRDARIEATDRFGRRYVGMIRNDQE